MSGVTRTLQVLLPSQTETYRHNFNLYISLKILQYDCQYQSFFLHWILNYSDLSNLDRGKRLSIKDIRTQGRGDLSRADIFGQEVVRMSALFSAKKLRVFRNLWCVRKDKDG